MPTNTTMTDEQINAGLAKAMYGPVVLDGDYAGWIGPHGRWIGRYDFEPATSHDAFQTHVETRLEEMGLLDEWAARLRHRLRLRHPDRSRTTLVATATPRDKSEVAIEVMGGATDV